MSGKISKLISKYLQDQERTGAPELASYLVFVALLEMGVQPNALDENSIALPILWGGSMALARDALKRPILDLDDDQEELFPEQFSAFLCVGKDAAGEWTYTRRRACTQEEYRAGLNFLEEKADQLRKKIDRYRNDYNTALPFWTPGITFAEAYRLAMEHRG